MRKRIAIEDLATEFEFEPSREAIESVSGGMDSLMKYHGTNFTSARLLEVDGSVGPNTLGSLPKRK